MKSLPLLIIAAAFSGSCKADIPSGHLLSLPVYSVAIGRWYKEMPPRMQTRRNKKNRLRRQSPMYTLAYT